MTSITKTFIAGPSATRRGFTLVELAMVIGIMVLLAGILLPAVTRAYRAAERARVQADFQTISNALEAYKDDFLAYPTVGASNTGAATLCKALIGPGDAAQFYTGTNPDDVGNANYSSNPPTAVTTMQLPSTSLVQTYSASNVYSAGDVVQEGSLPDFTSYSTGANSANVFFVSIIDNNTGHDPPALGAFWAAFNPFDGKDGVGIRTRFSAVPDAAGIPHATSGKVYGPYLQTEAVHVHGLNIIDRWGHPILYFPANKTNVAVSGYVVPNSAQAMINASNNLAFFRKDPVNDTDAIALARLCIIAGDYNVNGTLDSISPNNEPTAPDVHFFLWSAGPDGIFGPSGDNNPDHADGRDFDSTPNMTYPANQAEIEQNRKAAERCDDITNFK